MSKGEIDNILSLDEANSQQRQRQLYGNDLKFDPDRPIYQLPLNLDNYIDDGNQSIFQQMVRNILLSHPQQRARQLSEGYESTQQEIDNLNHGYINQLQNEEVRKTLEQLKKEIEQKKVEIENLNKQNIKKKEENMILQQQIGVYKQFVQDHQQLLIRVIENENTFAEQNKKFQQAQDNLENDSIQILKMFQTQYNTIVFEGNAIKNTIEELKKAKNRKYELENEISTIRKLSLKLQDHVDNLKKQIKNQEVLDIDQNSSSKISKSRSSNSEIDPSERNSVDARVLQNVKRCHHIEVKNQANKCLIFLIIATCLLTLLTIYKFS